MGLLITSQFHFCISRVEVSQKQLVRLLLLVLVLVAMWLSPPTLLTYPLWSLLCLPGLQLLMSSTRASQTKRLPYWRESSVPYTSSARRGGDLLGAASSAVTPTTSSPTAPRGGSSIPPPTSMTTARATIRRSTVLGTRRRRTSRRCCLECVPPSVTSTSSVMTPPAQRRMRGPSARQMTSPTFALWTSRRDTSPTPM
jgi:hypothetical protein